MCGKGGQERHDDDGSDTEFGGEEFFAGRVDRTETCQRKKDRDDFEHFFSTPGEEGDQGEREEDAVGVRGAPGDPLVGVETCGIRGFGEVQFPPGDLQTLGRDLPALFGPGSGVQDLAQGEEQQEDKEQFDSGVFPELFQSVAE